MARSSPIVRRSRNKLGANAPEGMVNMAPTLGAWTQWGHWPCGQSYEVRDGPRVRSRISGRDRGTPGAVARPLARSGRDSTTGCPRSRSSGRRWCSVAVRWTRPPETCAVPVHQKGGWSLCAADWTAPYVHITEQYFSCVDG
jgi:hypothetical protein